MGDIMVMGEGGDTSRVEDTDKLGGARYTGESCGTKNRLKYVRRPCYPKWITHLDVPNGDGFICSTALMNGGVNRRKLEDD